MLSNSPESCWKIPILWMEKLEQMFNFVTFYSKIIYNDSNSTTQWKTLSFPSVGLEDNLFCNVWRSHVASGREEVFTIKIRYSNWQTSRGMVVFMSFSDAFNAIITSIRVCLISTISHFYVKPDLINKSTTTIMTRRKKLNIRKI